MEILAHRSYRELDYDLNFWRTKSDLEVDFILGRGEVVGLPGGGDLWIVLLRAAEVAELVHRQHRCPPRASSQQHDPELSAAGMHQCDARTEGHQSSDVLAKYEVRELVALG